MPKFFRKSIPKTITSFLGEILIVVLGIFIAVQLNNWNEDRKEKKEEQKSLILLLDDLKTEKITIDFAKNKLLKGITYLVNIKKENYNNLDSVTNYLNFEYVKQKINSSYINLKYGGRLNSISNDTLKSALTWYYELYYSAYEDLEESQRSFVHNNVRPYILKNFTLLPDGNVDSLEIVKNLKDKEFQNLISYQIEVLKQIDEFVLDPTYIEKTISYLEKEITKFN